MTLVPSRRLVKRDVSYEFMNRQMVWHAFTVSVAHESSVQHVSMVWTGISLVPAPTFECTDNKTAILSSSVLPVSVFSGITTPF